MSAQNRVEWEADTTHQAAAARNEPSSASSNLRYENTTIIIFISVEVGISFREDVFGKLIRIQRPTSRRQTLLYYYFQFSTGRFAMFFFSVFLVATTPPFHSAARQTDWRRRLGSRGCSSTYEEKETDGETNENLLSPPPTLILFNDLFDFDCFFNNI